MAKYQGKDYSDEQIDQARQVYQAFIDQGWEKHQALAGARAALTGESPLDEAVEDQSQEGKSK